MQELAGVLQINRALETLYIEENDVAEHGEGAVALQVFFFLIFNAFCKSGDFFFRGRVCFSSVAELGGGAGACQGL